MSRSQKHPDSTIPAERESREIFNPPSKDDGSATSTVLPPSRVVGREDFVSGIERVDWRDRLFVAVCELPVHEGEEAVAEAIVDALAEIFPELGVGACVVTQLTPRVSAPQLVQGVQQVIRRAPPDDESRVSSTDPTRLFPRYAFERIVEVEPDGSTLHLASDEESVLDETSLYAKVLAHASRGMGRGLSFARAHGKATLDAEELRALSNHMVQAEKLASLGQLAAGVVHELNNPLTSIVAYTDYLLKKKAKDASSQDDTEKLSRIRDSAERMLRFTRDLTTYARPSRDVAITVEVFGVIEQALAFCDHVIDEVGATVDRRVDGNVPQIRGMPEQLAQVFVNLFTNACHAMPREGGGRLSVQMSVDGGSVRIVVEDNGHGIPDENREAIFVPFFTTKADGRGTGLGLSIVKSIIEHHDGEIWAESASPRGTRFVILLPAA